MMGHRASCCLLLVVAFAIPRATCDISEPSALANLALQYFTNTESQTQLLTECTATPASGSSESKKMCARVTDRKTSFKREAEECDSTAELKYNCDRQRQMFQQQKQMLEMQQRQSHQRPHQGIRPGREVAREQSGGLKYTRFMQKYAEPGIPLLVEQMTGRMLMKELTLSTILKTCGRKIVTPVYPSDSPSWGGLHSLDAEAAGVRLSSFLSRNVSGGDAHQGYLFDWGLFKGCPQLLKGFTMPSYMARNLMKLFPPELTTLGRNWPSLFIGKQGTKTKLHVDAFNSHFWALLLKGRKRWRIYPREDIPALYPNMFDQTFIVGGFESSQELIELQQSVAPLLNTTRPWDFEQRAGELVLVPFNCPHQVYNEEDTISLAGNYLDSANWPKLVQQLRELASAGARGPFSDPKSLVDFIERRGIVEQQFTSSTMEQDDEPWGIYKRGM